MIISVINQKGGVGKTTTTVNLGAALAAAGQETLVIDLDLQRDLSAHRFLSDAGGNPRLMATDAAALASLTGKFPGAFALIDCPPALGPEAGAALELSDMALVPVVPEFLAVRGLARLLATIDAARSRNPRLKARSVITMFDSRSRNATVYTEALHQLRECPALATGINRSVLFERASAAGLSILQYAPRSPGATAYRALAQEIIALNGASQKASTKRRK